MLRKVLGIRVAVSACALLVGTLLSSTTFAADAGENAAFKHHCVTCHGWEGKSSAPRYPNLAGQNAAYLVSRLKYFRAEEEPGNQMNAQAVLLTDEEIDIISEYFSKQAN
ncbi:MAG: cytochrome c [Pseudomonadales bacterium]|jgi:cytochrome c553|nr:cytochrome c [Pseudomonadales bacterium]|tara:strand:- start:32 stop:361 length:330 start_codon:yes stop_codon:yes gene_type:complete